MAHVSGITIEKDIHGHAKYARIDLRKYGEQLQSFFKEVGLEKEVSSYNSEFVEKIKRAETQESKSLDLEKYGISI